MKTSKKISLETKSQKDFFARGKMISQIADEMKNLCPEKTIWFEDVKDFNKFINENKIKLLAQIRETPCSITELANKIKRNRASVTRDVNELEKYKLVKTQLINNDGHGKIRLVKPIAKHIILQIKI
ncbi:MAG: hypothetical protein AB7V32_03905 [Candidatus Berkiella sp.]